MKLLPAFPSACLATALLFLLSLTSCANEVSTSADGIQDAPGQDSPGQDVLIQDTPIQNEPVPGAPTESGASTESGQIGADIPSDAASAETVMLAFEKYIPDELNVVDEGGCGMTLLEPETIYWQEGAYFFRGFSGEGASAPAYIKLDGELVPFTLTSASGESFYGQRTSQTFESADGAITLEADVALGELGEIESVAISEGTLTLKSQGQTETVAVVGDAGC